MEETSIDDTRPLCSDASGSICNHRKAARKKVTQIDPQRAGPRPAFFWWWNASIQTTLND